MVWIDKDSIFKPWGVKPPAWAILGCAPCNERERIDQQAAERKRQIQEMATRLLDQSGIGKRFRNKTFENFTAETQEQKEVLEACKRYAADFGKRPGQCLIMIGAPGTGKTHVASAIINRLTKKGKRCAIVGIPELFRRLKSSYQNNGSAEILEQLIRADLSILDDVGIQMNSDWEFTTMFDVLDARYRDLRSSILISNLSFQRLEELLGKRLVGRLLEDGGLVLTFFWKDRRLSLA
ncbi:MAG: ATP-binding protein [Elusimicrobia bacterium]|nr:ATP-binding protein [Elusimicrobiota bacterium]